MTSKVNLKEPCEWLKYNMTESEFYSLNKQKRYRLRHPEYVQKFKDLNKAWAINNPIQRREISRKYFLKRDYSMTQEDYVKMLNNQKGKCAICGTEKPTGKWKVFAVDHCHTTGKIRGLLCNECNRGMGLLGDNVERLRKAAEYLDKHKKES